MKLKSQYKTAGTLYATGAAVICLSNLKHKNGQFVFMPKGRDNLLKTGGYLYIAGSALHVLGNVRVATRAIKWIAKKVFK